MQIVILCGGEAKRLGEMSKETPKSLLKLNKIPFMKYLISFLIPHKPSSLHFCLGKFSDQFIDFFKKENFSIPITYSIEDAKNLLGTGGALRNCVEALEDNFIVQYGDTLLNIDYNDLYQYHFDKGKDMTMSILPSEFSNEPPNLLCKINDKGIFHCLYDKKSLAKTGNYIDYGAIVFNKKVFKETLPKKFDLAELQKELTSQSEASFYLTKNKYIEIGTVSAFKSAVRLLKNV